MRYYSMTQIHIHGELMLNPLGPGFYVQFLALTICKIRIIQETKKT
jgi:hypothetical protein